MPGALTRWEPFAELGELRSRFDRIFGELSDGERSWMPAIDVERDNGNLVVRADVPGIKPEEVKIEVSDGILTVSGEHEERRESKKDKRYLRRERRYGAFSRSMALPPGVEAKKIKAKTHDGIVEVTIPLPMKPKKETVTITPTAG